MSAADVETTGNIVTFNAQNGHTMQYWEHKDKPGKPAKGSAWESWCSPSCAACCEGHPLPDY